jgi:hypothetical protein
LELAFEKNRASLDASRQELGKNHYSKNIDFVNSPGAEIKDQDKCRQLMEEMN